MNDQLQETVNTILKGAIDQATKGAEFLKEQIPDILQQVIAWNMAADALTIALWALVSVITYFAVFRWSDQRNDYGWKETKFVCALFGGFASGILAVCAIVSVYDLLKLYIAPKVWLLEYGASLIKHGG